MTSKNVAKAGSVVTKMSHREIAKLTGKKPEHVVRDIESMLPGARNSLSRTG